ncbi:Vitamin B12 transporter BtuB precursor [Roseivivax sp. THAF40]|uniref:TonB-dependent receptor plug domain-containing protein n=1 Tax=unclassified Roseivivax TaxID=2639302 RepID=UPI00126863FD|nr:MULTISPECIES: TonB-dependent receptor [unclassified Roseivivax]QFS83634.1 Vitamin B12 transporter BtuB precursor [Roseivivax sp. THAF197b]QFT47442.1 Vitamin B12 transporter BtuB precursor [Roseivivax sp. THAF40]
MSRLFSGVSVLALSLPLSVHAQDVLELAPITIYGNVTDLPLSRTGATVEIIDEEALEDAPSQTLAETVASQPGVSYTQAGGPGQPAFVRLRGLPQRYAPVLVNGIDVTDPSGVQSQFDWSNILASGVTGAEIIKGSQSALYGSEAVGGVIALTAARAPDAPSREGSVSIEAGAYDTQSATLSYGLATERAGFAFSFGGTQSEGYNAVDLPGYDEDDGFEAKQASLDAYVDVTDTLRLGLTGIYNASKGDFDPTFGIVPSDLEDGDYETYQRGYRGYAELQTGAFTHSLELSQFRIGRDSTNAFGTSTFEGERRKIGYLGEWDIGGGTILSFGADRTIEEAESAPDDVETDGLFAELVYAATPDLDFALSLRNDHHSEFGDFTAARGAVTWRATPDITVRASVANGYRAPSLYELYDPTYGDASLDPEESVSFDLGIEKVYANGASVSATLFKTEIDDLIVFDGTIAPFGGYAQSSGTSTSEGVEIAAFLPIGDRIGLTGAFTYTDARDADDDPELNVPRYDLSLGIDAEITDRVSGGLTLRHVADFPDTFNADFSRVDSVDDYTVVNARASFAVTDDIEAYLRVENLFDSDYETIPDYDAPGRSAYFGVRASF